MDWALLLETHMLFWKSERFPFPSHNSWLPVFCWCILTLPLGSEGQGGEKAAWLNNRLCPAGGRGRWLCPWLLHVRRCVWPCLPCRALDSLGLPKVSHTKEVSSSTSGEAQLAKVNVNSSAL